LKQNQTSVLEMAKGALIEQVNAEFAKIGANILDLNTDPKKARKITLTVTFKPDENREFIGWEAQAKSTLAPVMPVATRFFLGTDKDGTPVATEIIREDPNQVHMFDEQEEVAEVGQLDQVQDSKVLKFGSVK
jgi:hypothetical protein